MTVSRLATNYKENKYLIPHFSKYVYKITIQHDQQIKYIMDAITNHS